MTVSGCCGASERNGTMFDRDNGFCAECKNHCEYVKIEDTEEE